MFFRPLLAAMAAAATLAGCAATGMGPQPRPYDTASGCRMTVADDAYYGRESAYLLEASATSNVCVGGDIEISLRTRRGAELWRFQTSADVMFLSQDVQNRADMAEALTEWVAPPQVGMTRTIDLPKWRSGRSGPGTGREEFPFYPAEGMTRTRYEQLRARKLAMFCVVQGLESLVCIALDESPSGPPSVVTLGFQSFPG